jgi:N-terminal half of MaoC dehydratase
VTAASVYTTPQMRSIIGRPFEQMSSYPISVSDIRKWAIAVYYPEVPPQLYWDEAYAATTTFGGIVAPEDFNPFAWATVEPRLAPRSEVLDLDWNYIERQQGIDGPGLPTMLNGGSQTRYGVRMRPGDVISSESHVRSYTEKQGRTAILLLTVIRSAWTNQRGEMVKETDRTSIRY